MLTRKRTIVAFALLVALLPAVKLFADPITVQVSGTGTGSLNGNDFSNRNFVIFGIADTDNIEQFEQFESVVFRVITESSGVSVDGFGSDTFTGLIQIAANDTGVAGFGNITTDSGIAFVDSSDFETYSLDSSIGPITGQPLFNPGDSHLTSNGEFILEATSDLQFLAIVSVPEPSAATLLLFSSFAFLRHKRERKTGPSSTIVGSSIA